MQGKRMSLAIVRPAIVGPAWISPRPGWCGPKPSTLTACLCLRAKGVLRIFHMAAVPVAVIPVDVVSRTIIVSAFASAEPGTTSVVHAAWSPKRQPDLTWHRISVVYYYYAVLRGLHGGAECLAYLRLQSLVLRFPCLFRPLHALLNRLPFSILGKLMWSFSEGERAFLARCLRLPVEYQPFMAQAHLFQSSLRLPPSFSGDEYVVECLRECEALLEEKAGYGRSTQAAQWTSLLPPARGVAGGLADLGRCLSCPQGRPLVRVVGVLLTQVLRRCVAGLWCDLESLGAVQAQLEALQSEELGVRPVVVLAPSHRSYLDFCLLTWMRFLRPELGAGLPYVAAAQDAFSPALAWYLTGLGALFLRRGGALEAGPEPQLGDSIRARVLSSACPLVEVFLEGTRSRDGRFQRPKTGFLRCLLDEAQAQGRPVVLVPLALSYERAPEEGALMMELQGQKDDKADVGALLRWTLQVLRGRVRLGHVHIRAGPVVRLDQGSDVKETARRVQEEQRAALVVTPLHVRAAHLDFGLDEEVVRGALAEVGCGVMEVFSELEVPDSLDRRWVLHLQWMGRFARQISDSGQPEWGRWLLGNTEADKLEALASAVKVPCNGAGQSDARLLAEKISQTMKSYSDAISHTVSNLKERGFQQFIPSHVVQYCQEDSPVPVQVVRGALAMLGLANGDASSDVAALPTTTTFRWETMLKEEATPCPAARVGDEESFGCWGFRDSRLVVLAPEGSTRPVVTMEGSRYALSGRQMPGLLRFFEVELGVSLRPEDVWLPCPCPTPRLPPPALSPRVKQQLAEVLPTSGQISYRDRDRCRHGTGHAVEDVYRLRSGRVGRMPDVVVWPEAEAQVLALVQLARAARLCLIPFGGGTNVTHALSAPEAGVEPRPVVSVDVRRMKAVVWVNEEDGLAEVQAGIVGRDLRDQLAARGLTMGHEPDSIEFSTLGGWIATKASGMKRSRYGNIEDIVLEVRAVTAQGVVWQGGMQRADGGGKSPVENGSGIAAARVSQGLDLRPLLLGSEGNLGIITSAVIKVHPLPACTEYDSIAFRDLARGVQFMRELARLPDGFRPASVRLLDNAQLRLGKVLRGSGRGWLPSLLHTLRLLYGAAVGGLQADRVVGATILYEGSREEVAAQRALVNRVMREAGGVSTGAESGRVGYDLTFGIAYLRDFAMTHFVLGESFETFVNWSRLPALCQRVRERVHEAHHERGLQGRPFITARVTQIYSPGACVYFYLALYVRGLSEPHEVFKHLENEARRAILACGGTLSHHHGTGKAKAPLLATTTATAALTCLQKVKEALDPDGVFGVRNSLLGDCPAEEGEQ
jgi:alkyldihydroxyacetonephosphate synthase